MKEHFFIYNNDFFSEGQPVISAGNRSLRYGDGLFETMRMQNGEIVHQASHFERLYHGLQLLQFKVPDYLQPDFFIKKINVLLHKNGLSQHAKIRLMLFRGNGELFTLQNNTPNYIIETSPLPEKIGLNEKGLRIDVFPNGAKSCDGFSNLKTNNYLLSVMAGLYAQQQGLDDCILLNTFGKICESAVANVFIFKGANIYTPPLTMGCVAGIVRRCILEKLSFNGFNVIEKELTIADLMEADELFLTNSIHPAQWVKSFKNREYGNYKIASIFPTIAESV